MSAPTRARAGLSGSGGRVCPPPAVGAVRLLPAWPWGSVRLSLEASGSPYGGGRKPRCKGVKDLPEAPRLWPARVLRGRDGGDSAVGDRPSLKPYSVTETAGLDGRRHSCCRRCASRRKEHPSFDQHGEGRAVPLSGEQQAPQRSLALRGRKWCCFLASVDFRCEHPTAAAAYKGAQGLGNHTPQECGENSTSFHEPVPPGAGTPPACHPARRPWAGGVPAAEQPPPLAVEAPGPARGDRDSSGTGSAPKFQASQPLAPRAVGWGPVPGAGCAPFLEGRQDARSVAAAHSAHTAATSRKTRARRGVNFPRIIFKVLAFRSDSRRPFTELAGESGN